MEKSGWLQWKIYCKGPRTDVLGKKGARKVVARAGIVNRKMPADLPASTTRTIAMCAPSMRPAQARIRLVPRIWWTNTTATSATANPASSRINAWMRGTMLHIGA